MKSKKIFVLLSALALLLGACNAGKGESKSQKGNSNSQSNTSETSQGGGQEDDVPVTAITLNKNELSLEATKSETLTWTVAPANASDTSVTFESDHPEFATVSNMGKITGVAVGNATITVKSVSNPEVTATCAVTVTEEGGKYGSLNKPKSVEQALAIAAEECAESNAYTAEAVYVTGYISRPVTNKDGYSLGIYIKDSLTDANAKEFLIYSADHEATLTPYQNDKIIAHGYIQNYNDQTIEMTSKSTEKVVIDKVERGTSSIAYSINDGQFNADAPKSAKNLTEVTLTITPASGKVIHSVVVNGKELAAEANGSYKMRVAGNMTVVANIFDEGVTIVKDTMKYTGTETTNMVEGNNATTMNLDANIFTVESTKTTGPYAGLNKNGDFRLYNNRNKTTEEERRDGTTVTVSSKRAQMKKILITLAGTTTATKRFADMEVKAGDQVIAAGEVEGVYAFNSKSFSMQNVSTDTASQQFHIASVDIFYVLESKVAATGIAVAPTSGEIQVDKDIQLTATLTPANATDPIVWKSADETKAKVSQTGKVTGVAEANAVVITAFADANENGQLDTGEFKAEATIKVTAGEVINYGTAEAPLNLEEAKAVLDLTGSDMSKKPLFVKGIISTNGTPNSYGQQEVWFQNADGTVEKYFESWSTVIDSKVTGDFSAKDSMKGYEAVITGYGKVYNDTTYELTNTTIDGTRINPTILSMKRDAVDATAISLPATAEVDTGKTITLTPTLTPSNATSTVSWKSSDDTKATVANGKVTGVAAGSATITAFIDADGDGAVGATEHKAECVVTVNQAAVATSYKLDGTITGTGNNYNNFQAITQNDMDWKIQGNVEQNPWRIGGKSLDGVDRRLYSETAMVGNTAKIEIDFGTASQITVNSMRVDVYSTKALAQAGAAGDVATFAPTFAADSVVTVNKADTTSWNNCFFGVTLNVTVNNNSQNKFVQLKGITFTFA